MGRGMTKILTFAQLSRASEDRGVPAEKGAWRMFLTTTDVAMSNRRNRQTRTRRRDKFELNMNAAT